MLPEKRYNVLVISSDEHARSALGCAGHPYVKTPTLDKLAALGTRFTRAYTPSPICVPARASLATGLHVHEHECWSSAEPYSGQVESWMHRLRDQGHATVAIGKLHFRSGHDDNGFSEEINPMHVANEGLGWPQALVRGSPLPAFPQARELAQDIGQGDSTYSEYDRHVAEDACRWLSRYPRVVKDKPWALFVSFVSPHYPLVAPEKFYNLYEHALPRPLPAEPVPDHPVLQEMARFWDYDSYFDDDTRRTAMRAYFGLCSFLDDNVRRVLEALSSAGADRDTIVIYLSDHGEMLGKHGFWTKSVMYEESVGIPLSITGPGIAQGVNATPVSLVDIAATVERAVGVKRQHNQALWQGHALQEFIEQPRHQRILLSEYHDGGSPTALFMLRHAQWKYVHYAGGHPAQLFDLETDASEMDDLGQDERYAGESERLLEFLHDILDPESINERAFSQQAKRLTELGGAEQVLDMPGFNYTPIG